MADNVFFVITTVIGSGMGVHAVVQAFRYGQLVQRVLQLEHDHVRTRELTDRIFGRLDDVAQTLARIEAHMPKRSDDK